jgi:hypothetical protein
MRVNIIGSDSFRVEHTFECLYMWSKGARGDETVERMHRPVQSKLIEAAMAVQKPRQ